jgi:DNA-binding transcriptional LysR family regulator
MSTIDLNRIRLFLRVAEAGSFTGAAHLSRLPKSSVSRAIAALERELGVRLIQRTTRRLQLTEAGRAYYESVSRALSSIDEAAAAVSELQDTPRGPVRITAPPDIGHWLLASVLVRFTTRYPDVHIEASLTQRIVDLVHEGFDLALRVGKLADNRLVARPLGMIRAGIFAAPQYLKRRGPPRSIADLAAHECVLFRGGPGRAVWPLVGPAGRENVEVRGAVAADDGHFIRATAAAGQGLALLPIFACSEPEPTDLLRVLPEYATVGEPLQLVYPSARFLPKRVVLLRDQLVKELPPRLTVGPDPLHRTHPLERRR